MLVYFRGQLCRITSDEHVHSGSEAVTSIVRGITGVKIYGIIVNLSISLRDRFFLPLRKVYGICTRRPSAPATCKSYEQICRWGPATDFDQLKYCRLDLGECLNFIIHLLFLVVRHWLRFLAFSTYVTRSYGKACCSARSSYDYSTNFWKSKKETQGFRFS